MELALARRYKRWRHGRGFGIHSPFAYDFITRTLRERLPYYGYDDIDAARGCAWSEPLLPARRLRLLFRILARFNPPVVAVVGEPADTVLTATFTAVRHDIKITDDPHDADFIIVNGDTDFSIDSEKVVVVFPDTRRAGSAALENIWRQISRGMRFDNGCGFSIIVADPKLPRQQFDVRF